MAVKLKIIVKDDEWVLTHKCYEYDDFEMRYDHPLIMARVQESIDVFPGDKDDMDVDLKADMVHSSKIPTGKKKKKPKEWSLYKRGVLQQEAA